MSSPAADLPVVAAVVRGGFVEGHHHGSVVALAADGSVALSIGRPDEPMLPRSCAKPLQAVGMLRLGLEVDEAELAIICASHSGEPHHVDEVRRVLAGAGLTEDSLDNTPGMPTNGRARRALIQAGIGPSRITHNCSGKHAGMLATCVAAGWPTAGYREPGHPLQQALRETIEQLTGDTVTATVVDGCGAALFAVTLTGLARAFAAIATAPEGTPEHRCYQAMRHHPELIGGHDRDVTALMVDAPDLIAKDGAEGVYAIALNDGRAAAVKIDDGNERARLPVLIAALRELDVTNGVLELYAATPVMGHGERVGQVQPVGIGPS